MTEERTETAVRRDRYSDGPARAFLSSLAADERIFEADLAVDRAHVVMLAEQEIIGVEAAGAILGALEAVETVGYDALPGGEDVHEAIETAVIDRVGEDGARMHTARSRNDEVATCIRYRLRADLLEVAAASIDLRDALLTLGMDERETIMPGYTHLQPAQPTTVGHWASSYADAIARDTARLLDGYPRVNRSPLGGAAFAGTPFPIDRERTASLLGFEGLVENAMDAAAGRDVILEVTGHLATLATTLSGLAADLILFANRGFVELDDDFASTSSIMPQKKNPDTLELVRATSGDATAGFTGLLTTLKGLPRAYNRDLQSATPHTWKAVDAVVEATTVAAGAVSTATWRYEPLATAAGEGFSTATGVADRLTMEGMPFRIAHSIVASAAERVESAGDAEQVVSALQDAAAEQEVDLVSYVDVEEIEAILDPMRSVESRGSRGGPAPGEVASQVERASESLEADRARIADHHAHLATAATTLATEVSRYD